MHKLLARQLKRHLKPGEAIPEAFELFLKDVDAAYHQADEDRALLEHSMETVSQELTAWYRALREEEARSQVLVEGKRRADELALLHGTLVTGTEAPNLPIGLERMLEQVCRHNGWPRGEVWLPDSAVGGLTLGAAWPGSHPVAGAFVTPRPAVIRSGEGLVGRAFLERQIVWAEAMGEELPGPATEAAGRAGITGMVALPTSAHDEVTAVVVFFLPVLAPEGGSPYELLSVLAEQFATVIHRKKAEKALRESQGQLLQSQKMEAVGRLAGGIAHDFNNLLTVIGSNANLALAELRPKDPLKDYLEQIRWASERSASLTRQLLAFSRKQVLQPVVLDLNAVVINMQRMLYRLIGEHIELVSTLQPGLGLIRADPHQVEQVIMNLVINAREAMPGGGRLIIETADAELTPAFARQNVGAAAGPHVMLRIRDTGRGMDRATLSRIFEPFFTTHESGKGTGLGLSTCYGIVKQSGGSIWAESVAGSGTTFTIYLPRIFDATTPTPCPPPSDVDLHGKETVLVVEDEPGIRRLVRHVLGRWGYNVLEASSGMEALAISDRHREPIHLLLTDVIMPRMSGAELTSALAPSRPEMRVLYMSGYTNDAIAHLGVLNPGAELLEKPFTPEELAHRVRKVLVAAGG